MSTRRSLLTWPFFIIAASVCGAASQTTQTLRERIPNADPNKYKNIHDGQDWRNPYLVVHGGGIEVLKRTPPGKYVSIDSALSLLESLPDSAWPYGRIVAVQDANILSSMSEVKEIRHLNDALFLALAKLDVELSRWPA